MSVVLHYLTHYLLAEPDQLLHKKNGILFGTVLAIYGFKRLHSATPSSVKDKAAGHANSLGGSLRRLWRRIVIATFPKLVGNAPEKRWGLLYYGLPAMIAYVKLRDVIAVPCAEHVATLCFFLLNIFYYVNLPPKRNRFTPTISSLYVDQGWTISFQYAACAGYMYLMRGELKYLRFLAAVAGIFVFRTARTNLNTKDSSAWVVFHGESKSKDPNWASDTAKLPKDVKPVPGMTKRRGDEQLVTRNAEPDDLFTVENKLGFKPDEDFYTFQTVPPYPQPDSPVLGRFHMFFVTVLMSLTLADMWHDNTDDRLVRGVLSMLGYGAFGSASAMMFEQLEAEEKEFWKIKSWNYLITRRRYVEILCMWSFTCELLLLCQTLA